ncbi:hypothetical protein AB833_05365 [Chromatiales bacterium (ex Bugula neritina AB1)]|nr:hypothetical protein AB833_05365 [Chromatiales bacterium (ex Bugula neritina AB1)]
MIKIHVNTVLAGLVGLSIASLIGCGNSSTAIDNLTANTQSGQAIDGYLVGADVFCDGTLNGRTGAAGRFECPAGTTIVRIRGGSDVGFDESATSGGIPFSGELTAPGGSPFVTPLSTLATSMASTTGRFEASNYQTAIANLAVSLDVPGLDLNKNPANNLNIAKVNAQINQLINNFAANAEDYTSVSDQLSRVLATRTPFDLTSDTATIVSALNERLIVASPGLALTVQRQVDVASELQRVNSEIKRSTDTSQIDVAVEVGSANSAQAFTIDQTAPLVRFKSASSLRQEAFDSQFSNFNQFENHFTLNDFQNDTLFETGYTVDSGFDARRVEFATTGFDIKKTLENQIINVALEFRSTLPLDNRRMSVTVSGATLSMTAGDNNSVQVTIPTGTVVNARAIDRFGVITNVTTDAAEDYFATNEDGNFEFSITSLENDLTLRGYHNFTREAGNYSLTLIISGVGFGIDSGTGFANRAAQYTIRTANESITGTGLQGYFTTR